MAAPVKTLTVKEQIQQLNEARKVVLENAVYYSRIVQGILPIIGPTSPVELRRWGADFLAESLATPALSAKDKEELAVSVLETLKGLVENPNEDILVMKASVVAAASAYPMVLSWIMHGAAEPERAQAWQQMTAIKSRILRMWDGAQKPIEICCVKFAQRVVLAQTTSNGMDMKNGLDVSLAMIPAGHPLLDSRQLEAEATGLLDRMLGVLQDNSSDALLVDATLNTLSVLVRTRPGTSNRILNAVLGFNPLKLANSPMTPKLKVLIKSMEKTTRMLLYHLAKRDPNNPMSGRLQQQAERLARSRAEILDEAGRKRMLPEQGIAGYGDAKRQRLDARPTGAAQLRIPPLAPGPQTVASLFTLTNTRELQSFDVKQVPAALATRISVATLATINPQILEQALNAVQNRFGALYEAAQPIPLDPDKIPLGVDEDDDDYEPDFYVAEDTEQILNKLDSAPPEEPAPPAEDATSALATLGTFKLPPPPALDSQAVAKVGQAAVSRVFGPLSTLEDPALRKTKSGINRLAASSYDRDAWLTLVTRLATRSVSGLEDVSSSIKPEDTSTALERPHTSLADVVREMLYAYILEDFRRRIEVAVAWLCEEWYNDQITRRSQTDAPLHYEKWALRLVDGFLDYLTPQDKVLTRFLAEIPELSKELLGRVKSLCSDPTRVQLALTSLLYLVMMKPPVRDIALDTVADIWQDVETARPLAAKYLVKWRPGFIESRTAVAGDAAPNTTAVMNTPVPT